MLYSTAVHILIAPSYVVVHFEVCHSARNCQLAETSETVLVYFQTACVQTTVTFKVCMVMSLVVPADLSTYGTFVYWETSFKKI
jgi:hypothetical protein